jgi:hypothetical protein
MATGDTTVGSTPIRLQLLTAGIYFAQNEFRRDKIFGGSGLQPQNHRYFSPLAEKKACCGVAKAGLGKQKRH